MKIDAYMRVLLSVECQKDAYIEGFCLVKSWSSQNDAYIRENAYFDCHYIWVQVY